MELRHLLYFKKVAEELHFRKAAEKLFISQPPLSRQIRELEEELDVMLFERNNKRVELTPEGAFFKQEVDLILSRLDAARHRLKEMKGAVNGQLRIGYISSIKQKHLIEVLEEMKQVFPLVKIRLYELPTVKQVKAIEDSKLDVGLMRAPVKSEKLVVRSLFEESFVFVVPGEAGRFESADLLVQWLKVQPFIFFNKDYAPDYFTRLIDICQRLGFTPEVSHEVNNVHSIMQLVEKGMGVSIVPASLQDNYAHLKVSFYEIPGSQVTTEVVLAYKSENIHPALSWFVKEFKG